MIVGVLSNSDIRSTFEEKFISVLSKHSISATNSKGIFDTTSLIKIKSAETLLKMEKQLLQKEYNAVLLTKIIGIEDKTTTRQSIRNIETLYSSFRDDYTQNQYLYAQTAVNERFKVYHVETSLYCFCPEKEEELLWKGTIDIKNPRNIKKGINDYVQLLISVLQKERLLIL